MSWTPLLLVLAVPAAGTGLSWERFQQESVVEILTTDEDGDLRETSVWIVSRGGVGYVRTNDSRWLANIRRGSDVALRLDGQEFDVIAEETDDPEIAAQVEEAFKEKYGLMQRVMSFFRISEPTVLELTPR